MFLSTGSHDDLESFDGNYNGQGLPTARTGGIHYDHKWNNDLQSINTNYKIGYLSVEGHKNTQTQNILPSETIKSNADQNFDNNIFRQKLDLTFETRIDTSSTLKLVADATVKNSKTRDNFSSFTQNESDTLLNKNSRSLINNADQQIFNMTEFYARKFKKKGRTLSLNLSQYINDSNAKGYLNSTTNFYNSQTSALDSTQITNQYKTNNTRNAFIGGNITYTESIFKSLSLVVNYGIGWNTSSADRKSFNASSTGMFTVLDTTYSNNYQLNQLSNQLGAILAYNTGKSIFNFGTKATETGYDQTNKYTGGIFKRSFLNWNPTASFQYKFAQQRELKVSYTGNSVQPNIDQIQPIRINSDPLNINIGNQFLKPSFNNAINLTYSSYKTLNNQSIWFNGAYNFTENAIVNNVFTDNTGKNTFQAVNLSGHTNYNYTVGGYFVQRLKHLDVDAGFDMTATGNVSFNMVNNVLNAVKTYTYSTNLLLSKYKQKGYDLRLYTGPNYTISTASLQPDVNNNGFGFNANADCKLYLPGKFKLISNFNYQYKAQTKAFEQSFSRVIINATISKAFLKQQNLQFSVSGNDLLNQNQDFVRSNFGNLITQTFNSTIKRYILFSVTWDFSQMFKKSSSTNK